MRAQQFDGFRRAEARSAHVGRAVASQIEIERLRRIRDVAPLDQRLGDVRPADGAAGGYFLDSPPLYVKADGSKPQHHLLGSLVAPRSQPLEFRLERRVRRIDEVTEHVNLHPRRVRTQLDALHEAKTGRILRGGEGLGDTLRGVVVRNGDYVELVPRAQAHQLGGGQVPVGSRGVQM